MLFFKPLLFALVGMWSYNNNNNNISSSNVLSIRVKNHWLSGKQRRSADLDLHCSGDHVQIYTELLWYNS